MTQMVTHVQAQQIEQINEIEISENTALLLAPKQLFVTSLFQQWRHYFTEWYIFYHWLVVFLSCSFSLLLDIYKVLLMILNKIKRGREQAWENFGQIRENSEH